MREFGGMIRFACPRCKAIFERPDSAAGSTFACVSCGQALQVPAAATGAAPASPLPAVEPAATPPPAAPLPPPILPPTYVTAHPETTRPTPSSEERAPRRIPDREPEPRRRPSRRPWGRDRDDEDDDYDDDLVRRPTRSRYSREVAIKAATSGFVCALIGLALLVIAFILFIVITRRPPGARDMDPLFFVIVLTTVGSFIMGLMGTVFSARGLDESNNLNRGFAVAGLVCSIIDLVLASIAGLILLCFGLVFWSFRM